MAGMRRVFLFALILPGVAGCMNCQQTMRNPIIVSSSGQAFCARHHIPLVTVRGYAVRGWNHPNRREAVYTNIGDMVIVEACNPNSILPQQSLHRSKQYPERALVRYCPRCQAAVEAAVADGNPNRMPSLWRQITTQVYVNSR
jgi:hypothetical protein